MISDTPFVSPPAVISLCAVVLLYGIHLLIFPATIFILLRKPLCRSIIIMLGAVFFMFAMSTLLTVTLWTSTVLDGTITGIYFNAGVRARILMWPRNMNVICADAMVIQRMFVLYESKLVRYPMGFLLFCFTVLSLFNSIGEPIDGPLARAVLLATIASFLSFGLNFIATAAISIKAWRWRRIHPILRKHSPSHHEKTVKSTLLILIETGFLYLVWQLLCGIMSHLSNHCDGKIQSCASKQYAANAFAEATTIVAAVLPTSTIVIVALRRSIADSPTPSPNQTSQFHDRSQARLTHLTGWTNGGAIMTCVACGNSNPPMATTVTLNRAPTVASSMVDHDSELGHKNPLSYADFDARIGAPPFLSRKPSLPSGRQPTF